VPVCNVALSFSGPYIGPPQALHKAITRVPLGAQTLVLHTKLASPRGGHSACCWQPHPLPASRPGLWTLPSDVTPLAHAYMWGQRLGADHL
jgi:hypothetical protein